MKNYSFLGPSISKRLPLLICALLLTSTIIFGWISYVGMKDAALKISQDRLPALAQQISSLYPASVRAYLASTRAAASQPAIKKYLQSNGKDSALEVAEILQILRQDTSFVQVELLNAERKRIIHSANEGVSLKIPVDSILPLALPI